MASVSASHMIMFVASLLVATAVAGTVIGEVGVVSSAIENRGSAIADDIETDIAIISDESQPQAIVSEDGDEITVLVKNVGNNDIPADASQLDILVDGSHTTASELERVDADSDIWEEGGVVEVTIEGDVSGDTSVTVIASGNEDSITFYAGE